MKTFETPGAFIWNPYLELWNLPKLYLRTFAGNLDRHLEPSRTYTLTWMEPICFTWNLGIFRNLYLEPLLGTSEPSRTLYDWNLYLEPRNLPEPLLGTLILGTSEPSEPYLEPLLGTSEPAGTFTWNPYSEPRNLPEPLLGTLTWNLGTCQNLAGWLPQSAPGLSLARTPKLSAVGEKDILMVCTARASHPPLVAKALGRGPEPARAPWAAEGSLAAKPAAPAGESTSWA